nr:RNA-directed DNA polymerase, eukaryota [Tanacetum cinerariifolium]
MDLEIGICNEFPDHCTARDLWNVFTAYGKIKDINALSNLYNILAHEGFDNFTLSYLGGFWVRIDAGSITSKEKMLSHVAVASWLKIIMKGKVYWIPVKEVEAWTPEFNNEFYESSSSDEDSVEDDETDHVLESSCMKQPSEFEIQCNVSKQGTTSAIPFGIYDILNRNNVQEKVTKDVSSEEQTFPHGFTLTSVNDKARDEFLNSHQQKSSSHGNSDGMVFWRNSFNMGFEKVCQRQCYYIRESLSKTMAIRGKCVILGDFNEVRFEYERFGTNFNDSGANAFNHFISSVGLIDLPLEGYSYTWALKSASKMSKLDRFLILEGLLSEFPSLSALCLDRNLSDHRPIIMRIMETNKISLLKKKLKALKSVIKTLCKEDKRNSNEYRFSMQSRLTELDKLFDKGKSTNALISFDQNVDLEINVNYEEIKCAVWDCGTNKSPRPDGFTFEFFCRYWNIINQDVMNVVQELFASVVMSDASSAVTYTFVYTDFEPWRYYGEDSAKTGPLRVIVYGYDGLPIQPVAPPSLNYVPGPEHPPSPDYVPGPEHPPSPIEIPDVPELEYPEYLAPSDDEAPLEEQPLPDDASPIAASSVFDPKEEPFEEDDEVEEEHPALADSSVTRLRRAQKTVRPEPPMTDILEADMSPRKRTCLTTPALGFEIRESSAAGAARQPGPTESDLRRCRGVNERVIELDTTIRQRTDEFETCFEDAQYDRALLRAQVNTLFRYRPDHHRTTLLIDREAMYSRKAWAFSMDRSSATVARVRTLETQVVALITQTTSL